MVIAVNVEEGRMGHRHGKCVPGVEAHEGIQGGGRGEEGGGGGGRGEGKPRGQGKGTR